MAKEINPDLLDTGRKSVAGALSLAARTVAAAALGAYALAALKFIFQNFQTVLAAERWAIQKLGDAVREPEAGLPAVALALLVACLIAIALVFVEQRFRILKQIAQHLKAVQTSCTWSGGFWSKVLCVLIVIYVVVVSVVVILISVLVAVVVYMNLVVLLG